MVTHEQNREGDRCEGGDDRQYWHPDGADGRRNTYSAGDGQQGSGTAGGACQQTGADKTNSGSFGQFCGSHNGEPLDGEPLTKHRGMGALATRYGFEST
jgi:hypothetical protein